MLLVRLLWGVVDVGGISRVFVVEPDFLNARVLLLLSSLELVLFSPVELDHDALSDEELESSPPSFNKLVDDLSSYLWSDEVKSKNSTSGVQPIDQRFTFASGLRWLGGHDHSGLEGMFHIS
jgi:hypothetical protein